MYGFTSPGIEADLKDSISAYYLTVVRLLRSCSVHGFVISIPDKERIWW